LYNSLKQFKNESLASFKLRMTNALKVLQAVQEIESNLLALKMALTMVKNLSIFEGN
jgi:hypothetical protein